MFLGIDLGTPSLKALLVDAQDRLLFEASAPLDVVCARPSWSEQNPHDWWHACQKVVLALPANLRREVRGIGLSGQMHGAVLLDAHDDVLRPAILWNDGRSALDCAELERREPRVREITGNLPMAGFTAPKLLWVRRHEPDIFLATRTVLLPKDYLRLRMTGAKISDLSDASGTLWLDVGRRAWSDEVLSACDLQRAHMPSLVEGSEASATLRADIAHLFGMQPSVVVAGGGGDNAASAIGTGVTDAGQAFLSLGTSGVLFVATDTFRPSPDKAAHAFCHALPGRWHQMSVMLTASSALDWASGALGYDDLRSSLAAAACRGLHAETPLFLPYLQGERTPHNDPFARGVFFGMTGQTTRADLVVAVLEGVALAFADGLDTLIAAGGEVNTIAAVGGGIRHAIWLDYLAAALGHSLARRSGGEAGAAFGAARLGRLAATRENPAVVCTPPPLEAEILPQPALAELMRRRRPHFTDLYSRLRRSFREFSP
jgi:xylulokinase